MHGRVPHMGACLSVLSFRAFSGPHLEHGRKRRPFPFLPCKHRSRGLMGEQKVNIKKSFQFATVVVSAGLLAITSHGQLIVEEAALREAIRQQTTWTSENIQRNPYLFIQDQIRQCDSLKAKIEAQTITLTRMGKEAARKVEEADGMKARYTRFLAAATAAYDEAEASGKWPVTVNGYEMDEEELGDKMDDAATRIELAEKEKTQNTAIGKKVEIRQGILKKKKRELANIRLQLVQQAEQVKMNAALAEIEGLQDVLGTISDMMIEIDEDPTKLSIDDLTSEDPDAAKKARIKAIRERAKQGE